MLKTRQATLVGQGTVYTLAELEEASSLPGASTSRATVYHIQLPRGSLPPLWGPSLHDDNWGLGDGGEMTLISRIPLVSTAYVLFSL